MLSRLLPCGSSAIKRCGVCHQFVGAALLLLLSACSGSGSSSSSQLDDGLLDVARLGDGEVLLNHADANEVDVNEGDAIAVVENEAAAIDVVVNDVVANEMVANEILVSDPIANNAEENSVIEETQSSVAPKSVDQLRVGASRPGFISLHWQTNIGDTDQTQPSGDTVSYYRVYRDGEFFVDTFSPYVEDNGVAQGEVVYGVEAHKFLGAPDYVILQSEAVEIKLVIPSFAAEAERYDASSLSRDEHAAALAQLQSCVSGFATESSAMLCDNGMGYSWLANEDGSARRLFGSTSSVAGDVLVSVRNTDAELGPVPGIPTWSVKNLSSGEVKSRDLIVGDTILFEGEGYVVNGVASSDDGTAFISGTIYQSYLPRNLGPEVGLLPVTNAYYLAQFDTLSGSLLQHKRFSLSDAPGAAVRVTNGLVEMHKVGLVSWHDTATLARSSNLNVSGYPVFSDADHVYTRSYDPEAYYRFNRTVN